MNNASEALDRIEAILADIERLDRETGGQFRQPSDKQALLTVTRIEKKMRGNTKRKSA
jgi:hypothetical protein